MKTRPAVFADQGWYPRDPDECRATLESYQRSYPGTASGRTAGVVPHAGWAYSGEVAGWTFQALEDTRPEVVFLFGGHLGPASRCSLMVEGAFATPLRPVEVATSLARELAARIDCRLETADRFEPDNTIELQLPFIAHLWPNARVVAVQVPPSHTAVEVGDFAAELCRGIAAISIGSTDLTHYGANYGFTPKGIGPEALRWSREENDRPFIDRILALDAEGALEHALGHASACCPGAAAGAAAFARRQGIERGQLVDHRTSQDARPSATPRMWVGYAGVVF